VFVIGADRSGVSILTCALGQHPAIPAPMNTDWLGELAGKLPEVYEATIGLEGPGERAKKVSVERFCRTFGRAAAALVGDKLDRWVDGDPEHTLNVPELARLFPEARFIHVVRDADAAIGSLVAPPLGSAAATGGTQIPARLRERVGEQDAVQRWMTAVLAGVEAETTLGRRARPARVLRRAARRVGGRRAPLPGVRRRAVRDPSACGRCATSARASAGDQDRGAERTAVQAGLRAAGARAERRADRRGAAPPSRRPRGRTPPTGGQAAGFDRASAGTRRHGHRPLPEFSETFFVNKFLELRGRGWDVHVVCYRSNKEQWEFFASCATTPSLKARLHVTEGLRGDDRPS
jgi:hypothetical protein